ncbi:MAG: hypothetical protein CM1200mP9_10830 [Gammaproteobacteria bacterium]|nr:MAG: hypothetical protein CM1200mP9_10830 [Gammaproteobacteria bacterium]
MEIELTSEDLEFRQEVRDFLKGNAAKPGPITRNGEWIISRTRRRKAAGTCPMACRVWWARLVADPTLHLGKRKP